MIEIGSLSLSPSKERKPFFDGANEESAELRFNCAWCGNENRSPLLSLVEEAWHWTKGLNPNDVQTIWRCFDVPLTSFDGHKIPKSHEGGIPYFGLKACCQCGKENLFYLSFTEIQPARYVGVLQGVVQVTT